MARWTTSFSSGSRWPSAWAVPVRSDSAATKIAAQRRSSSQAGADERERIVDRELLAFRVTATAIFELAGLQATLSDNQAVRNAQQFRIGEFDPRTSISVVIQHFDSSGGEL